MPATQTRRRPAYSRFCPECKGFIKVNQDGSFRRHRHVVRGYICGASGTPAPTDRNVPDFTR